MSASELERLKRIKQQMREAEKQRFANPDRDFELERMWVAHVWAPTNGRPDVGEWLFAGFRRRRNRRKPQTMNKFFSKVRRQLLLDKKAPVMLMELGEATKRVRDGDNAWRFRPPQFQTRKRKMEPHMPEPIARQPKRRVKDRAPLLNRKSTAFIALGRMGWPKETVINGKTTTAIVWERNSGHLYLGPLTADTKREAIKEAKRLYPVYRELIVVATDELSKPLRAAMARSRKVRAGVTRIQWPEVRPEFEDVFEKWLKKHPVNENDDTLFVLDKVLNTEWHAQGCPWLTVGWFQKQVKRMSVPSKVVYLKAKEFQCRECKLVGPTPASINHGSPRCVPIPQQESAACAATAKAHAIKMSDRRRKRSDRKAEVKRKKLAAKVRRRAAKKAARTRAKAKARLTLKKLASRLLGRKPSPKKSAKRPARKVTRRSSHRSSR